MTNNNALVSILIPAYKKRYLADAILSVLNQSYKNIELIIVNDKSPEDLTEVVNSFKDDRIRYYINEENIGGKNPAENWNKCLSFAQGEFVSLLCDDDMYEPTFVERMLCYAEKYPTVDVFRARIQYIDKDKNITSLEGTSAEYLKIEDFIIHFLNGYVHVTISEWFIRKSRMIISDGYFKTPMAWYADSLSMFRFGTIGGIVSNSEILLTFRQSGINISSNCSKYALLMIDALSYFEDEVTNIVTTNQICYHETILKLLSKYVDEKRDRDFQSKAKFILKGIINRKKYRLSFDHIIKALYTLPLYSLARIREKVFNL